MMNLINVDDLKEGRRDVGHSSNEGGALKGIGDRAHGGVKRNHVA